MVFLAVDIGNSRIKCGLFEEGRLTSKFEMASDPTASAAAYRHSLRSRIGDCSPTAAGVCSVVPALTEVVCRAIRDDFMVIPTQVGPRSDLPFELDYAPPESLGADRVCSAAAAFLKYGLDEHGLLRPLIVVDSGSAVTYDVISDGCYRGGAIAPGPSLAARALAEGTAQLSEIDRTIPSQPIGNNTQDGLRSGIMFGFVDSVAGMLDRIAATLDSPPFVVATGGGGQFLANHVTSIDAFEPDLVLEGVDQLARRVN